METICSPGYHHSGFVKTHAIGHIMYGYVHRVPYCMSFQKAIVVITGRAHCFHDNIYITYMNIYNFQPSMLSCYIYIYIYIHIYIYIYNDENNVLSTWLNSYKNQT